MPGTTLSRVLFAIGVLSLAAAVPATALWAAREPDGAMFGLPFMAWFAAGAVAWRARAEQLAARRLLAFGVLSLTWVAVSFWLGLAVEDWGTGDWLVPAAAAVVLFDVAFLGGFVALCAVYPDGRYQRSYERRVVRIAFAVAPLVTLGLLLGAERVHRPFILRWLEERVGEVDEPNPLHVPVLGWLEAPLGLYAIGVLALLTMTAAVLLALRYRRFERAQRLQIAWPVLAVLILALTAPLDPLVAAGMIPQLAADLVEVVALLAVPVLFAIGIVRPDLLDVERLLRRSLLFGALWIAIAAVYVGAAAALGIAAGAAGVQIAVLVTIAATLIFLPLWRRGVAAASRRVYGDVAELAERARELEASRARIVEAEERARRRIERDIHDGVQQELVALIARIGLARMQLARDPSALDATLDDLRSEAQQALADLRELAGGIHPSVLTDRGIVDAIEARASRLPLGVTIECERGLRERRFGETVEGAAYFVVCEGFANALKHSGAERVVVRLEDEGGALRVEVADDGRGFDSAARGGGTGLAGLADRVDALGGELSVRSAPGEGTNVTVRLPVHVRQPA